MDESKFALQSTAEKEPKFLETTGLGKFISLAFPNLSLDDKDEIERIFKRVKAKPDSFMREMPNLAFVLRESRRYVELVRFFNLIFSSKLFAQKIEDQKGGEVVYQDDDDRPFSEIISRESQSALVLGEDMPLGRAYVLMFPELVQYFRCKAGSCP